MLEGKLDIVKCSEVTFVKKEKEKGRKRRKKKKREKKRGRKEKTSVI